MRELSKFLAYEYMPSNMEDDALKGIIAQNLDKDFIRRIYEGNNELSNRIPFRQSEQNPEDYSSHFMGDDGRYVFPNVSNLNPRNTLEFIPRSKPIPEDIKLESPTEARWFAENYKRARPEMFEPRPEENSLSMLYKFLRR